MGHLSRDCPTWHKIAPMRGSEVHIHPNCPERSQTSLTVETIKSRSQPYLRIGWTNGRVISILLDTGSHHTLAKTSVASVVRAFKPTFRETTVKLYRGIQLC